MRVFHTKLAVRTLNVALPLNIRIHGTIFDSRYETEQKKKTILSPNYVITKINIARRRSNSSTLLVIC